jgi:hypothetical protein
MPRSCAFSASSCSSSPLEICLFESPLGWRRRSRATCRLTTFFILFDRAILFMNRPPPVPHPRYPPSVNNRWSNRRAALGSDTAFPQRPAVGAPSIQQCSELKPPEHSRRPTSNSSDSSATTAASWISPAVCSVCHTRHMRLSLTSRLAGETALYVVTYWADPFAIHRYLSPSIPAHHVTPPTLMLIMLIRRPVPRAGHDTRLLGAI